MSLLIQKPGILTTIQDLGRHGYRRYGINPGGAMDAAAARLVNIALGNDENEGVLEMHFPAAQIVFESDMIAAVAGADLAPQLDELPIENWRAFLAKKGSVLKFQRKISGNRTYLGVRGGFKLDQWLGSASTNLTAGAGGFGGRKLSAGDKIRVNQRQKKLSAIYARRIATSIIPMYRPFPTVRAIRGPEFENLQERDRELFIDQDYTISNRSNRMGFRLAGEPVAFATPHDFISSAVSFGTIQVLPDGQLIVLMADHQTAGGYPRIAQVIARDLPLIGQLGANDKVAFHLVDIAEAEALALEFERELSFLRIACRFQANTW